MTDELPDGVLSPSDLGPDEEAVRPLEDGRRVVLTDEASHGRPTTDGGTPRTAASATDGTQATDPLADLDGAYALTAAARAETSEDEHRVETDDVSAAFESLLRWYAEQVSDETRHEDVVAVLLANTDLDVEVRTR